MKQSIRFTLVVIACSMIQAGTDYFTGVIWPKNVLLQILLKAVYMASGVIILRYKPNIF